MEHYFSNEPVRAIKQYICIEVSGPFLPITGNGSYEVGRWYDAQQRHLTGFANDLSLCTLKCMTENELHHGFHSWKRSEAEPNLRQGLAQWIEVELAGIVIEHEKGYRATRQRIIRVMGDEETRALRMEAELRLSERERRRREENEKLFNGHSEAWRGANKAMLYAEFAAKQYARVAFSDIINS